MKDGRALIRAERLSSMCTVFAQSEVVSLIARGASLISQSLKLPLRVPESPQTVAALG